MRIRDWSSDGCSSDLRRHRAAPRARARRPVDLHVQRGRRRVGCLHPSHHRVARRAPSRRRSRGAPRRPAALPLPLRHRVVARRLSQLAGLPVTELKGVGPERAKALAGIDITTVFDLLTHYPRRYLDKTKQSSIRDAGVDETLWIFGKVVSSSTVQGSTEGQTSELQTL